MKYYFPTEPRRQDSGFTLVEMLMAIGISGLSILLISTFIWNGYRQMSVTQLSITSKAEISVLMKALTKYFFDSVYIYPSENLIPHSGSHLIYSGIQGLNAAHLSASGLPPEAQQCRIVTDATSGKDQFSALYLTSLQNIFPERLLASWNENQTGYLNDHLRITQHSGEDGYAFKVPAALTDPATPLTTFPPDILLVDGMGLSTRRYRVTSVTAMKDHRDPVDSLVDKSPEVFQYTVVHLDMPKDFANNTQNKLSLGYVPNSLIYGVDTKILCSDTDGKVIFVNTSTGKTDVIFDAPKQGLKLKRFEISYFHASPGTRLDRSNFLPFPLPTIPLYGSISVANSKSICINAVKIRIELEALVSNSPLLPWAVERNFLLFNHNSRRPAGC